MSPQSIPLTPPTAESAAREIAEIIRATLPETRWRIADDLLETRCRAFLESFREQEASQ
ncbi:MAG: hypothetical protein WCO56_01225 [Verrucomicrobiota bacterium]